MSQTDVSPAASAASPGPAAWNSADAASDSLAPTQFVSFAIGDDQYGVDIMAVREIKGWSDITHLPKQPEYVRGVLNLRGSIVPIIDVFGSIALSRAEKQIDDMDEDVHPFRGR